MTVPRDNPSLITQVICVNFFQIDRTSGTLYEEEEADQDINDESDVEDDEEFDMNLSYE